MLLEAVNRRQTVLNAQIQIKFVPQHLLSLEFCTVLIQVARLLSRHVHFNLLMYKDYQIRFGKATQQELISSCSDPRFFPTILVTIYFCVALRIVQK